MNMYAGKRVRRSIRTNMVGMLSAGAAAAMHASIFIQ